MDYSQIINRYTSLYAYSLPNMEEMVCGIATYKYFSELDLKSACHQVPVSKSERINTAFNQAMIYTNLQECLLV